MNRLIRTTVARERWLALLHTSLVVIALLASVSRGAWLAAVVGLTVLALVGRRRELIVWSCVMSAGLLLVTMARFDPAAGGATVRVRLWKCVASLVMAKPLLGYGPNGLGLTAPDPKNADCTAVAAHGLDHSDNALLDLASDAGVLGLAAFLGVVGGVSGRLVSWAKRTAPGPERLEVGAIGGAMAAYLTAVLFTSAATAPATLFWVLAGLACRTRAAGGGLPFPQLSAAPHTP